MEQRAKASEVDGTAAHHGAPREFLGADTAEKQRGGGDDVVSGGGGAAKLEKEDAKEKTAAEGVKPLPHKQVRQPSDVYNPELERL
ncbi:hypothetical protein CFC21_064739 [Triticum aestivum]|uniref:Uncharacterized protein n=4 Tax=Triticum TaxID=4564 RepID=A0A9R0TKA2_TRITD|nr:uncharacterized protein LOC119298666 [Triticum dicoccoides]XP_044384744.1 uncharacterized protein LOC123106719 [Triticum aestivum]XP_048574648.1 uncharacterized protein LOC125555882 [Triticum urartu]VAI14425.1 unnamed protein product [Triticum turgidum subsp. durum]EMS49630.1 hypothetical protein TRIUR3_26616 [Triticum urartu]KAF7057478.1 hypothetical protein CFC21_064739 [Triticum aestivum]